MTTRRFESASEASSGEAVDGSDAPVLEMQTAISVGSVSEVRGGMITAAFAPWAEYVYCVRCTSAGSPRTVRVSEAVAVVGIDGNWQGMAHVNCEDAD